MNRPFFFYLGLLMAVGIDGSGASAADGPAAALLHQYCVACHEGADANGGVDLQAMLTADIWESRQTWTAVLDQLNAGKMPPATEAQPSPTDRQRLVATIDAALIQVSETRRRSVGRVPLRRLTAEEYEYTLRDLLHLPHLHVKQQLPDQPNRGFFDQSFSNRAASQSLSPAGIDAYIAIADHALDLASVLGPEPKRFTFYYTTGYGHGHTGKTKADEATYIWRSNQPLAFVPANGRWELAFPGQYRYHLKAHAVHWDLHENIYLPSTYPVYAQLSTSTVDDDRIDVGVIEAPANGTTKPQEGELFLGRNDLKLDFLSLWESAHKSPASGGLILQDFRLDGPIIDQWPPASYRALYGTLPNCHISEVKGLSRGPEKRFHARRDVYFRSDLRDYQQKIQEYVVVSENPHRDARTLLEHFMRRAFRRPIRSVELDQFYELARPGLDAKVPFQDAIKPAYMAVLAAPSFLFFEEQPGPLDDFALANRLSYFLWRSMPDEQLFESAQRGQLHHTRNLLTQVDRLLKDPRSQRFVESFVNEWLQVGEVEQKRPPESAFFTHDTWLVKSMKQETYAFFRELLDSDLNVQQLIDSDFLMINERLAKHYGIDGVVGAAFQAVPLPANSIRGGLMTQASILNVSTDGLKTHPILRGAWVARRIMGMPIPPPPPLPPKEAVPPEDQPKTLREEIALHSTMTSCRDCHRRFDSIGFALEQFDVDGRLRDFYRSDKPGVGQLVAQKLYDREDHRWFGDKPVESGGETADGRRFHDTADLQRLLLDDTNDHFARHLVALLLAFATGENVQYLDRRDVDAILAQQPKTRTLRSLIGGVVQSRAFLEK